MDNFVSYTGVGKAGEGLTHRMKLISLTTGMAGVGGMDGRRRYKEGLLDKTGYHAEGRKETECMRDIMHNDSLARDRTWNVNHSRMQGT